MNLTTEQYALLAGVIVTVLLLVYLLRPRRTDHRAKTIAQVEKQRAETVAALARPTAPTPAPAPQREPHQPRSHTVYPAPAAPAPAMRTTPRGNSRASSNFAASAPTRLADRRRNEVRREDDRSYDDGDNLLNTAVTLGSMSMFSSSPSPAPQVDYSRDRCDAPAPAPSYRSEEPAYGGNSGSNDSCNTDSGSFGGD